jgi:hypothetical protein
MPRLSSVSSRALTGIGIGTVISAPPSPYTLTPAANNVNEGSSLEFTVSSVGIPNGLHYWTVETGSGDFRDTSDSFFLFNNSGSFQVVPTADATTEGAETFTVSIRTGSITGPVVATSSTITINDVSTTGVGPAVTVISSYPTGISAGSAQTRAGITQSMTFSGSQAVPLNALTNANFAVYPVTVEAWVYTSSGGPGSGAMLELRNPSTGQTSILRIYGFRQSNSNNTTSANQQFLSSFPTNAWTHIQYTLFSTTGSTTEADRCRWAVNGGRGANSQTQVSGLGNFLATGETQLNLGRNTGGGGVVIPEPFTGWISEVRVSRLPLYGTTQTLYTRPDVNTPLASDGNTIALIRAV